MRQSLHKMTKLSKSHLAVLTITIFLLSMQPHKAHAQVGGLPTFDLGQWIQAGITQASNYWNTASSQLMTMIKHAGDTQNLQDKHDGDVGIATGVAAADILEKHTFVDHVSANGVTTRGTSFCPRVTEEQMSQNARDTLGQLIKAMQSANFWAGSCSDSITTQTQIMGLLCQWGFLSPDNFNGQNCATVSGYNDNSAFQSM